MLCAIRMASNTHSVWSFAFSVDLISPRAISASVASIKIQMARCGVQQLEEASNTGTQ
jgi:hypothetical protein